MSNCILYELTKLIEEWEYSIDDLDNIKILELGHRGSIFPGVSERLSTEVILLLNMNIERIR